MDVSTTSPRRTRRTLLWGLFGLTGIVMGTAFATGFIETDSTAAGVDPAANVFGISADEAQDLSPYQGLLTNPGDLVIGFDGVWGVVTNDVTVFSVDLSLEGVAEVFYVDIYLNNYLAEQAQEWSAAQLKWLQVDCTAPDFDAAVAVPASDASGDPKVMNITTTDAHVSFHSLAGGAEYCFGISEQEPHADDITGTFLTRSDNDVVPEAPDFTAIVNRSA